MYAWGAIAELESSLSGRSQAMQESVLLGKLRHLKHTLEICCQNSNATDFSGYSWTLARDYASKVSDEVDQQLITWQDLDTGVRTATLVSAQMEHLALNQSMNQGMNQGFRPSVSRRKTPALLTTSALQRASATTRWHTPIWYVRRSMNVAGVSSTRGKAGSTRHGNAKTRVIDSLVRDSN